VKIILKNVHTFFSGIWKGIIGIYVEILFTAAVILFGFLICVFWWGISQ